jgi:asparagine synthase (glutamine-hydrolysing)
MSVQFGRWNFDGQPLDREYFARVSELTSEYAPDSEASYFEGAIGMLFRPFHATKESRNHEQPLESPTGVVLTWDGRLDNRDELIPLLALDSNTPLSDAQIVLAAYGRWAARCFSRILGDWALVIWDPVEQHLLLAKDFAGVRHLFYSLEPCRVTWSTALDPIVLLAGRTFSISEEFVAGYLSSYPAAHLTPFMGVHAVPAGTYVRVRADALSTHSYWSFDPSRQIRYSSDAQYEEHFRSIFAQAVRRRLRSSIPVLAELSGGTDSTSIVCMADAIIAQGNAETPRLDTISYYDDSEPNWNERPYFTLVENKRGAHGHHIDVGGYDGALETPDDSLFFPLPGHDKRAVSLARQLRRSLDASGSRLLLSGIGGDEFLGGVPTPTPELQDLIVRLHWGHLARQLSRWSLQKRAPWIHLFVEAVEEFLPQALRKVYKRPRIPPWLCRNFVRRTVGAFWADVQRTKPLGPLPAFQSNVGSFEHLKRRLNLLHLSKVANHRISYPYLDRELLIFLFSIPREQLVRPHQRRSLMRRSLASIVPVEIFARKRKAFVARQPLALIEATFFTIENLLRSPLTVSYGWMDKAALSDALLAARHGRLEHMIPLQRTLKLELWLQTLARGHFLAGSGPHKDLVDHGHVHAKAGTPCGTEHVNGVSFAQMSRVEGTGRFNLKSVECS